MASRRRTNVAGVTGVLCLARPATVRRRSRSDDDTAGPNRAKTKAETAMVTTVAKGSSAGRLLRHSDERLTRASGQHPSWQVSRRPAATPAVPGLTGDLRRAPARHCAHRLVEKAVSGSSSTAVTEARAAIGVPFICCYSSLKERSLRRWRVVGSRKRLFISRAKPSKSGNSVESETPICSSSRK